MQVYASGEFGSYNKILAVKKIQHYSPRITNIGFMDESLRFIASNGTVLAVMSIPCNQADIATIGYSRSIKVPNPDEDIADCWIEQN